MSFENLLLHFGYPALVLGLLLEGETVLVLAAFMAHRGYLDLPLVIMIAWIVSFASDQFFFWMGRIKGSRFLEKRQAWLPRVEKAKAMLGRNLDLLALAVRFMYGFRTILPFVLGMSRYNPGRFALFDFIGAFLWAVAFGLAGKLIGNLMGAIFEDVREHEPMIVAGIIIAGACFWMVLYFANKARKIEDRK